MKTGRTLWAIILCLGLFAAWGASAPPSAQATSECLGFPTDAVQDWKSLYPCCFDSSTCDKLCEDWVKSCNDYGNFAFQCMLNSSKELLKFERQVECRTNEDKAEKKACERELRNVDNDLSNFLRSELRQAKDICEDCFDDCFSNCIEGD